MAINIATRIHSTIKPACNNANRKRICRINPHAAAGAWLLMPASAWAAPDTASNLFTVLLSLGLILGGFVAVAWFARRYLPGMGAQSAVKVVGTTPVGSRERVVVIEVDHTWLLLGVGGGNVRLLHTLPKPDQTPSPTEHPL